jgi:hypothetical protein
MRHSLVSVNGASSIQLIHPSHPFGGDQVCASIECCCATNEMNACNNLLGRTGPIDPDATLVAIDPDAALVAIDPDAALVAIDSPRTALGNLPTKRRLVAIHLRANVSVADWCACATASFWSMA